MGAESLLPEEGHLELGRKTLVSKLAFRLSGRLAVPDDLGGLGFAKRPERRQEAQGFEDRSLALTVLADQDVQVRIRLKRGFRDIAEVPNRETLDQHPGSPTLNAHRHDHVSVVL